MTLEELLNLLIGKGWKPFGMEYYDRFIIESNGDMCFRWKYPGADGESAFDYNYDYFKIREITSKESGLWQFVCENGMVKTYMNIEHESRRHSDKNHKPVGAFDNQSYYYLIESALCDEDKLEDFILSNIKINEN